MMEESLPSIWVSMQSWFTPTVLFIFINIVVGTIFFFSISHKQEINEPHPLTRTSSLFKSFTLYRQKTQDLIPPIEPIEPIETVETLEPHDQTHLSRIQSNTHPTAGEMPEKLPHKMKKSASTQSAFGHFHEEEIVAVGGVRKPSTTRVRRVLGGDEEVDAKADDFINRFKQQLKLQRIDSILRFKEMLNRGK